MDRATLVLRVKPLWSLLRDTANDWVDHKGSRLGAALAYYSVFSMGPLLIIVLAVAGLVYGPKAASGELYEDLRDVLGDNGAQAIQAMILGAQKHRAGSIATVISLGALIFAATGVIVQLKDALNTIWEVKSKPGKGMRSFVKDYLISMAALVGLGFILTVSLLLTTTLAVVGKYMMQLLPLPESLLHFFNFLVSFGILSLIFALIFKVLPDVIISWRDVWVGAVGTAFMFNLGKTLIGLYLGKLSLDSTYGAAASIMLLLIWVYYLAQVLYFGAEFTKVHSLSRGAKIVPREDAMLTSLASAQK